MSKEELLSHLTDFDKAIRSFEQWWETYYGNDNQDDDLYRDGLIQRFEYTAELMRKTAKRILSYQWLDVRPTPSDVMKEAEHVWLIDSASLPLDLIKIRNLFAHLYDEDRIDHEFDFVQSHRQLFRKIYQQYMSFISL